MSNDSKDSNQPLDQLTDHDYDGIQEYDNPLPNWWLLTFLGTIIFAFIYWIHYSSGAGPSMKQELDLAMKTIEAHKAQMPVKVLSDDELADLLKKADLNAGAASFQGKCSACHGLELQGQIGPNLTDEYWLHGKGKPSDILNVIKVGVGDKGMPAWDGLLTNDEIISIVAYIVSKQDTHPSNGKAPQGEKVR